MGEKFGSATDDLVAETLETPGDPLAVGRGLDVHNRESQICIQALRGELIEQRIRTEPEHLAAVLGTQTRIDRWQDSPWLASPLRRGVDRG